MSDNSFTFKWVIQGDFSKLSRELQSPLFFPGFYDEAKFYLSLNDCYLSSPIISLGRSSEDEGCEIVRVQWNLKISSNFVDCEILDEKPSSIIDGFERGYSRPGGRIRLRENPFNGTLIVECHIKYYSLPKNACYGYCVYQTKIQAFEWQPQSILEMKLHSEDNGLQYEISFHVFEDKVSIRIRRCDTNNSVECYFMYSLHITDLGLSKSLNPRREKIGWYKSFDIGEILEIPTDSSKTDVKQTMSRPIAEIYGMFITSVVNKSALKIAGGNHRKAEPTLKLDSTDILKKDLLQMYENQVLPDVKLQIDDKIFPAHKCLLSCRSAVFLTMFSKSIDQNQTGIVVIQDMDSSTLGLLLKYIYTGVLDPLQYDAALKLLLAAEKYEILSLKEKCIAYVIANLSVENVCQALVTADRMHHPDLKESVISYVRKHVAEIKSSVNWEHFAARNTDLAVETLNKISISF